MNDGIDGIEELGAVVLQFGGQFVVGDHFGVEHHHDLEPFGRFLVQQLVQALGQDAGIGGWRQVLQAQDHLGGSPDAGVALLPEVVEHLSKGSEVHEYRGKNSSLGFGPEGRFSINPTQGVHTNHRPSTFHEKVGMSPS